jgi:hypothetical protein
MLFNPNTGQPNNVNQVQNEFGLLLSVKEG